MSERLFSYRGATVPTVLSGSGAVDALDTVADGSGWGRGLIVTTPSVAKSPTVDAVASGLGQDRVAGVFADSREHTPISTVEAAYGVIIQAGAGFVIGVGGGSSMNAAKGVVLAALSGSADIRQHSGTLSGFRSRLTDPVAHALELRTVLPEDAQRAIPIVQIPTTLSAGEATHHAGITGRDGRKEQYQPPHRGPRHPARAEPDAGNAGAALVLVGHQGAGPRCRDRLLKLGNDLVQGVACNIRLLRELLPARPLAAYFHRASKQNRSAACRSESPSIRCSTMVTVMITGGTERRTTYGEQVGEHFIGERAETLPVQHPIDRVRRNPVLAVAHRGKQQISLLRYQTQRHRSLSEADGKARSFFRADQPSGATATRNTPVT